MFRKSGFAALACAIMIALSGVMFIGKYDLSSYSTNVIEAALIQIAQQRYLIASVFALIATICFGTDTIAKSLPNAINTTPSKESSNEG